MDRTDRTPAPQQDPQTRASGAPRTIAVIGSTGQLGRSAVEVFAEARDGGDLVGGWFVWLRRGDRDGEVGRAADEEERGARGVVRGV